jgi:uncharacterized repeat protein (TIGR01451 family)/gliding motility-associated-like protein
LCNGESATITATGCAGNIRWNTGATTNTINVSVTGTYTATCSNTCGESVSSNAIIISTGTKPTAPIISTNKNGLCNGESATITATGCSGNIRWNTGATTNTINVSVTGTYTATCSNTCGESVSSNAIIISTGTKPTAPIISTNKNGLCNGESATMTATGCSGNIRWNTGATTNTINVSVTGTYTATCSNTCGVSVSSNAIVISTGTKPSAPIISTNTNGLCNGESATITATGCSGNIRWNTGATTNTINVSVTGTYTATCSNTCGESVSSNAIVISTGTKPTAPIISTNTNSLCNGESATMTAAGCSGNIRWNTGATTNTINVSVTGTYTATCSNTCGESVSSNAIVISTGTKPTAPIISTNTNSLCNGESATMTATGCAGNIRWNTGATTNTINVSVTGTYTATCSNTCGESVSSNAIVISTGTKPTAPFISTNTNSLCNGESATITAAGCAGNIRWNTGATTNTINVSVTGTYTATCSNTCGESVSSNAIVISTGTKPSAPIISTNKNGLCNGESATITATGCAGNIRWNTGATTNTINVSVTGTYTATCSNTCGESVSSNAIVISTGTKPTAPFISTNTNSLCNGESATMTAAGCAGNIRWNTGATTNTINVSVTGTYTATCSNTCGESVSSNAIVISTGTKPSAPIISTNKNGLCNGESATITATGCSGNIRWNTGATTNTINVSVTGTYTATCSNTCGESVSSNAIVISTGTKPTAPIISTNKNGLCNGESATITATGCSGNIRWNTGATTNTINVSVTGTYTATCSNTCGESVSSNAIVISTGTKPSAPIISTNTNGLCNGESATITATGCSGNIRWNTGATTNTINVSVTGTYTATCSNTCGESVSSNAIVISTGTKPTAPIISTNTNGLCNGESATITATGCSGNIRWNTGATTNTINVSVTGTYTATCSNTCGESVSSNAIVISTGTKPTAPFISTNTNSLCNGESATITAAGCAGNIRWNTGATTNTINVNVTGTYTATCSNTCGESVSSNAIVISTGTKPVAPIISTNTNSLCNGESATMTATGCSGNIKWSTGAITNTINVSVTGTYTATCSNTCGESVSSNAIVISTGTKPVAPIISTNKNSLCNGESATMTATGCSGNIKWSTGAITNTINVSVTGTYTATCSNTCGESVSSNAIVISTGTKPVAPIISTNKNSLCNGESATMTATGCAGNIKWSTGAITNTINVNVTGTYTATCSNTCGESVSSNAIVISTGIVPAAPNVVDITLSKCNITPNEVAEACSATCGNGETLKWYKDGVIVDVKNIPTPLVGVYQATCSNNCGESSKSTGKVIINVTGSVPAPPVLTSSKTLCENKEVTLTATGCANGIVWSNGVTSTSDKVLTITQEGTYTAQCINLCGISSKSNVIVVTKGSALVITASKNDVCEGEQVTLKATGCTDTITWSNGATGTQINVAANESKTYSATCGTVKSNCDFVEGNIAFTTVGGSTSAGIITRYLLLNNAGTILQIKNSPAFTDVLTGNYKVSAIAYDSNIQGLVVGSNIASVTASCLARTQKDISVCNTTGTGCQGTAQIQITVTKKATAPVISSNKTNLCGAETANLVATGCIGSVIWNTGSTGSNLVVNSAGSYTATCSNICGSSLSSNVLTIAVGGKPASPIISTDRTICCDANFATLTATNCSSTITWSTGSTGNVLIVKETGVYTATCKNECGTSDVSKSITITKVAQPAPPVISAENTNLCVASSITLTASNCSENIKWSTGATTSSIVVNSAGTYTATCSNVCIESKPSNILIITKDCGGCITEAPVISCSKTTICKSENVVLTATGCIGGTIVWSNGQTGTTITVKPISTSNYTAVCKVSTDCISSLSNSVQIKVGSIAPPTITCSATFVCLGETGTLSGSGCEGTIIWSNGSTGNSIVVTPNGTTMYSAKCKIGDCESESSEQVAIPIGKPNRPYISCKSNVICNGGETSLTASGCIGIVVWSDGQTGGVIKVSPAIENTLYSAVCKSFGGKCESDKSNEVVVTVGKKVATPKVIGTITNICPFNTADINTAVLGEPSTNGGTFEFHVTSSPNSPLITSPSTVSSGTYYVFERSAVGCYSDFASIKVNATECNGGGLNPNGGLVDIAVKKVSSSAIVPVNEIATYKVVVKNVGQNKATGIVIRDILPNGLTYVSASGNVSYNSGIISVKIDSLKAGDSTTFTYNTKVVAAGKIINKAELFKINETDKVLSNNSSEYTINNITSGQLIGLSKVCEPAVLVSNAVYNVPFVIYVTNLGSTDISKIQVKDDLNRAFGNGAKILNDTIKIVADAGLVVNPKYTGRGLNTNLLIDSLSSIKKGQKLTLRFTVKVDLAKATVSDFFNVAEVSSSGKIDLSTNGVSADPDGDGDPSNNDEPTPIKFKLDISPDRPAIGIALSVHDTTKINKNCYKVTYLALIKNIGDSKLTNVQVTDSLAKAYSKSASFQVLGSPFTGKNSTLKVNPNYNGKDNVNLLIADSTSQLTVGQIDSVFYTVSVCNGDYLGAYSTNSYAKAIGNGKIVTDISNAGNVINANDNSSTVIAFPSNISELFIPAGFSPNGDGKNDNFIISIPLGAKIELFEVFNRWGQLIYKDTNGVIGTSGWDGISNQGLRLGGEGLPDGTYFYVLKLSNEKEQRVSYITLAR